MRYSSVASFCYFFTITTSLPASQSTPSTTLVARDDLSSSSLEARQQKCPKTWDSPIGICNTVPASIVCSTSAKTTYYRGAQILETVVFSAGDVLDNTDKTRFVFSAVAQLDSTVAQADPAFLPTFAPGCDPSKGLFWSPMTDLGTRRVPFPVNIGVFNFDGPEGEENAIFCGVMTNSHQTAEKKNNYQLCNAPTPAAAVSR